MAADREDEGHALCFGGGTGRMLLLHPLAPEADVVESESDGHTGARAVEWGTQTPGSKPNLREEHLKEK